MTRGRRLTIKDVAREAGVSAMTVSRVIAGKGHASEETVRRVLEVVDRLGYVPDRNASGLSSRQSGFVAMLVPSIDNSNFAQLVQGATARLGEDGLQILLGSTDYSVETEEKVLETLLSRRPGGVILTGGNHSQKTRRMLASSGVPVVETWDLPEKPIQHVVGFSNANASREMLMHLLERGYRRVGFVGSSTVADTRGADRLAGFVAAAREFGIEPKRVLRLGSPPIPVETGAQAIVRLRTEWPDTDAIMFVSDRTAFGALMECMRRGWHVPGDLAIAGFGDFDMARNSHPRITTVSIDCREMGRLSADCIQRSQPSDGGGEIILMPTRVLSRQTT